MFLLNILWIKSEFSITSPAPRGHKQAANHQLPAAALFTELPYIFSHAVWSLLLCSPGCLGGKPCVPQPWAQLVLCDSRQLSVTLSHARPDKSAEKWPWFWVSSSSDANWMSLSALLNNLLKHKRESFLTLRILKKYISSPSIISEKEKGLFFFS